MFESIIKNIEQHGLNVHGIELSVNGQTIFRHMFHADVRYPVYSCTKTVTALAVGIAVSEGSFDITRPLADYLPSEYVLAMPETRRSAFSMLLVSRFLSMSVSGYPFRPEGDDWLAAALSYDANYAAEPAFDYSNISAYLVGLACEYALDEPLSDFIQRRLFTPMGIENVSFQTDAQGRYYGATGIYLTLSELGRLGSLILQNGQGIVPESWIREMTKPHIMAREGGYGYFIYTRRDRVFLSGKWGQRSVILPDQRAVLTYMSDMENTSNEIHAAAEEMIKELKHES